MVLGAPGRHAMASHPVRSPERLLLDCCKGGVGEELKMFLALKNHYHTVEEGQQPSKNTSLKNNNKKKKNMGSHKEQETFWKSMILLIDVLNKHSCQTQGE